MAFLDLINIRREMECLMDKQKNFQKICFGHSQKICFGHSQKWGVRELLDIPLS